MAKIYTKGNYFFIEKDNRLFEALSKEVLVKKLTPTSTVFYFSNINNWTNEGIDLVDMEDESGTAYTAATWETFYLENTGSFSKGGGNGQGLQIKGSVDTYTDLSTVSDPQEDDLWYVRDNTGLYLFGTLKRRGWYRYNGSSWETTNLPSEIITEKEHGALLHNSSVSYYEGNLIWHNSKLQRCKADIGPKTYDANDWEDAGGTSTGGSDFWEATSTDTTAAYIYKGGLNGSAWQINRYERSNSMAKTSAKQSNNNGGYTTLTAAWADRLTINYA